jgi:hypothetical protein
VQIFTVFIPVSAPVLVFKVPLSTIVVVVVAFLSTIVDFFVVAFPNHVILARSGVCLSKFRGRCERN